jgi:glycosyltransferase involved in cell wall biosynthesis
LTEHPGHTLQPSIRVTCLTKRWQHHTASGGYDRLARELGGDLLQRRAASGMAHRAARVWWRYHTGSGAYLLDYRYEDWVAEWEVLAKSAVNPPDAVHVLYGDEQLDLLLRRRSLLRCALVATFHLPTSRVRQRFERAQRGLTGGVDAAVVVSSSQLDGFRQWFGDERVVYIPHGIDVEQFSPGPVQPRRDKVRLVAVGDHMRDWETLHRVIDECNVRKLPVEFDVVVRQHYWPYLTGCANTRLHTGIPEADLIALYRNADALLLPLVDSTVCQAVLESLACGTPVITTAAGGIGDYVNDACAWLFPPNEVATIVELIREICTDPAVAASRRQAAREKALDFDWRRVAAGLHEVYAAVTRGEAAASAATAWAPGSAA